VILSVGRLAEEKGFLDLLDAAARLKQRQIAFRLRIFGDGPQRRELERAIDRLGLADRVRLEGVAPHPVILQACAAASVVALASYPGPQRFQDGIANILVEAMACSTPVVSTEYEGSRELLEEGRWGVLVPPREPARLADALQDLLGDPGRQVELGRRGRFRVEQSFDRERNIERIAALFREALAGGGSPPLRGARTRPQN
jgi:glycosyltransferase involved in cell wall biosynthesis